MESTVGHITRPLPSLYAEPSSAPVTEKPLANVSGPGVAGVASAFEIAKAPKPSREPAKKRSSGRLKPGTGSAAGFGFSIIGGGLVGLVGGAVAAGVSFGPLAGILGGVLGIPVGAVVGGALYLLQLKVRQKLAG